MITTTTAWLAARLQTSAHQVLAAPDPTPTPVPTSSGGGSGGFDWGRIHPDPSAVGPKADFFYTMLNACMFLGVCAAAAGLFAGMIAFGIGPIFGAHIISDRGKSMMWRAGLVAILAGSGTSILAWLMTQ